MLVYIGIGSNLGDKLANCGRAIEAIVADARNRLVQCSPFYHTEPVGEKKQDWFVNGVLAVETSMEPKEFMDFLLAVEKTMGRVREERWGPRVIDLDILFYGQRVIREFGL
jgi:2-amino-4-hydroxy-6-hydroxymethyldihydropteridine diphosphokinase